MTNRDKFLKELRRYSDYNLACLIMDTRPNICDDYCIHENPDRSASYECPHNCIDGVIEWLNKEVNKNE